MRKFLYLSVPVNSLCLLWIILLTTYQEKIVLWLKWTVSIILIGLCITVIVLSIVQAVRSIDNTKNSDIISRNNENKSS